MGLLPLLLLLLLLQQLATAYNYCNNKTHVCDMGNMRHFVCHMDTVLRPLYNKAKYVATLPDTLPLRDLILDYHNTYRNKLAAGGLVASDNETFPAASRMRELIWDEELGYLARLHASTVSFKHSMCRSVLRFPYAGESLGLVYASTDRRTLKEILELTLLPMFEEYQEAEDPEQLIEAFDAARHHDVGHFTVIVSDRVSRVGCGLAIATNCAKEDRDGYCHFLTCHYDFTNMAGSYIYKAGSPASQCGIWRAAASDRYDNLCTNTGELFAKDHADYDNKNSSTPKIL